VDPVYLTALASRHAEWLTVRQTLVAENIANANTPGFAARDIEPFASVFNQTRLAMTATHADHLGAGMAPPEPSEVEKDETWSVTESGNTVSMEQELMKAGEINRDHALNAGIVKAFHRMYLASLKG